MWHYKFRKDFKKFMEHATKLSEAFQLVDNGPQKKPQTSRKRNGGGSWHNRYKQRENTNSSKTFLARMMIMKTIKKMTWERTRHKYSSLLLTKISVSAIFNVVLKASPVNEKREPLQKFKDERAPSGPSKSTRSQTRKIEMIDTESYGDQIVSRITTLRPKDISSVKV